MIAYMDTAIAAPLVDEPPLYIEIAANIRSLMGRHEVSQERVGAYLGMSQPTFSKRMHGKTDWTYNELLKIARFFNVEINEVVSSTRWFAESPALTVFTQDGPVQQTLPFGRDLKVVPTLAPAVRELALLT